MLKRAVSLGELLTAGLTIALVSFGSYVTVKVQLGEHESRIIRLEQEKLRLEDRNQKQFETIDQKIDRLTEAVYEMKTEMKGKQDRQ